MRLFLFTRALFLGLGLAVALPLQAWDVGNFKKSSAQELKAKLTPLQFSVTQKSDTERAFHNEYWDNHQDGIYVDVVSGEPLYSSKDKYDSGTGWPSFTKPLNEQNLTLKEDRGWLGVRTEVRSKYADSHLGHVFDDGPPPLKKRYCMNSAAMRFIPKEKLKTEGYGEFAALFEPARTETGKRDSPSTATVVLAGGCFWCMEPPFEALRGRGVIDVQSGYSGGTKDHPTYEEVSHGGTGHREVVQITYDPQKISLAHLLEIYWVNVDPFDPRGEFCDKGEQYTSAIFVSSDDQKQALT